MMRIGKTKERKRSHNCLRISTNVMFTQMSEKKGIKLFMERTVTVILKEWTQIDNVNVVVPENPDALTPRHKRKSIRSVNPIKEKRCGKINGPTCASGSTQKGYIPREDASSPTISLEVIMDTLAVDKYEIQDVEIFDVPGDYLSADIPDGKYVRIKLEGKLVDIKCGVNPYHIPNIRYKNGKKVLYLRIMKALYRWIEYILLWYDLYANTLKELSFVINLYKIFVSNKITYGKQCTIWWYVNNNKVSHVKPKVNKMIIKTTYVFG